MDSKDWAARLLRTLFTGNRIRLSTITRCLVEAKAIEVHKKYMTLAERILVNAKSAMSDLSTERLRLTSNGLVELLLTSRLFERCYCAGSFEEFAAPRVVKFSMSFVRLDYATAKMNLAVANFLQRIPESGLFQMVTRGVEYTRAKAQDFVDSVLDELVTEFDGPEFATKPEASLTFRQALVAKLQLEMLKQIKDFEKDAAAALDGVEGLEGLVEFIADLFPPAVMRCIFGALTYGADDDLAYQEAIRTLRQALPDPSEEYYFTTAFEIFEEELELICQGIVESFDPDSFTIVNFLLQIEEAAAKLVDNIDTRVKAEIDIEPDDE